LVGNFPSVSYVLALTSVAGVTFILASINLIFLLVLTRRESLARNWWGALPPFGLALLLALGEIALGTTLRLSLVGTITGMPGLE
jgi:apolipoprotein N-acyltransferase